MQPTPQTPIKNFLEAAWNNLALPVGIIVLVLGIITLFVAPIAYFETQDAKKPMNVLKCTSIKKMVDPQAAYSQSMEMCLSRKDADTLYSYKIIDKKIVREEVKL